MFISVVCVSSLHTDTLHELCLELVYLCFLNYFFFFCIICRIQCYLFFCFFFVILFSFCGILLLSPDDSVEAPSSV